MGKIIILLILLLSSVASAGQLYFEGSVKSIFSTNTMVFNRNGFSLDFSESLGRNRMLTEVSLSTLLTDKISLSYIGLYRVAGSSTSPIIGRYEIDGIDREIKKEEYLTLNSAVRYNALQVEGLFYSPFVRPIAKFEQVRINLGIGGDRENFDAYLGGVGIQAMKFYEQGTITGQAVYLAGGGSTGYDIEAGLKYYFPRLSSYLGAGYKNKSIKINDVRFNFSGPYLEIGCIF